jgi:hypothetical protein
MKRLIYLLLFCLPLTAAAQTIAVEAIVMDAQTQEPLPYASIYISNTNSTITNAEGGFRIVCETEDKIRLSFVGYKTKYILASEMTPVVELEPMATALSEVTVLPIRSLLEKAIEENMKQLKKNRKQKACFFYRQTAFTDSICYEFMEAFLGGNSALWLRNLALTKGRFAGIQPDSTHYYSFYSNFFITSQIQITPLHNERARKDDRYPLTKYYENHYDITGQWIGDGDDQLLAIHFSPKPTDQVVLEATLYFDANTLLLRKMEGKELNLVVKHRKMRMSEKSRKLVEAFGMEAYDEVFNTEFHFVVNMTEDRGFLEVQSAAIDEEHVLYDKNIVTSSVLFNIGDRKTGRGVRLDMGNNMQEEIARQGYDTKFWEDNEVVLRTPVEEQVMRLFEGHQLFGVFK